MANYRGCVASKKCEAPVMAYDGCDYQSGIADLPVNCIDWGRADNYCKVHAKRLPREDEWEYAASAGTQTRYPWGYGKPNCGVASMLFGELQARAAQENIRVASNPAREIEVHSVCTISPAT